MDARRNAARFSSFVLAATFAASVLSIQPAAAFDGPGSIAIIEETDISSLSPRPTSLFGADGKLFSLAGNLVREHRATGAVDLGTLPDAVGRGFTRDGTGLFTYIGTNGITQAMLNDVNPVRSVMPKCLSANPDALYDLAWREQRLFVLTGQVKDAGLVEVRMPTGECQSQGTFAMQGHARELLWDAENLYWMLGAPDWYSLVQCLQADPYSAIQEYGYAGFITIYTLALMDEAFFYGLSADQKVLYKLSFVPAPGNTWTHTPRATSQPGPTSPGESVSVGSEPAGGPNWTLIALGLVLAVALLGGIMYASSSGWFGGSKEEKKDEKPEKCPEPCGVTCKICLGKSPTPAVPGAPCRQPCKFNKGHGGDHDCVVHGRQGH